MAYFTRDVLPRFRITPITQVYFIACTTPSAYCRGVGLAISCPECFRQSLASAPQLLFLGVAADALPFPSLPQVACYHYPHFGTSAPVRTSLVWAAPRMDTPLANSCCTFSFGMSFDRLAFTVRDRKLVSPSTGRSDQHQHQPAK